MGTYKDSFILAATTFTTDGYIYTSNDNGTTWTKQTDAGKRNWTSITMSSDGTRLAATDFGGYIYTAQPPEYFLRIVKTGTGSGSVISTGGPINWDDKIGTTMHVCPQSTVLSALPTIGASFSGWTGCDSSSGAECTVTMTSPKEVTAVFGNPMTDQTLVVSGQGNGTITSSPSGINCGTQGSSCYRTYALNTMVTLTATPDSTDYAFKSWDGCDSTNGSQCTVIMSTSKNVGAVFVQVSTYNVSVSKTGGGTVTSSPMGLYCGTACSTKFGDNSTVVLTATADPGYGFSSWTGCDSSVDEQCTIKVNSDNRSLSVFFDTTANLQYNDAVAAMNSVYAQMSTFFGGPSGSVQTLSSSSGTVYVQWYATGTALAAWFDGYVWYYYNKVWYDTGVKWTRDSLTNLQKATSIINTLYNQNSAYYGTKSGDVTAYSGTSGKYYVQWYTSSGLLAWSDGYMYYYANGTWVYTGVAWK
ncbi:MAG: hypothetical protein HQL01_13640 [Nitrospirae bacterium]|nr:hypothetical protein [Nitrospirota bacterium]